MITVRSAYFTENFDALLRQQSQADILTATAADAGMSVSVLCLFFAVPLAALFLICHGSNTL